MDKESTRQKIIKTAIRLLGKEGLKRFTVRRVAEKSGVNVAAINYYFHTKDNLINEALLYYSEITRKIFAVLQDESLSPAKRLRTFLTRFATHLVTYPGFMNSIVLQAINDEKIDPRAKESMIRGRETILALLEEVMESDANALKDENIETLQIKLFQMMSCIVYPIIWGSSVYSLYNINFGNPQVREEYITILLNSFFPDL